MTNQTTNQTEGLTSTRPDGPLILKWNAKLTQIRGELCSLAKNTPNFHPSYVKELLRKLDEGAEFSRKLASMTIDEAKDVTIRADSATRSSPIVLVLSTPSQIESMVIFIQACHENEPNTLDLFMDTEGDQLNGGISLLQILIHSRNTVYLIDVLTLSSSAFTTAAPSGTTLKTILEDSTITKAFYDVRGDSHDFWAAYGISLAGIRDLNLYAIACYMGTAKDKGRGLGTCVQDNTKGDLTDAERKEWKTVKAWGKEVFKATASMVSKLRSGEESGEGCVPMFNQRPVPAEVKRYAAQDVTVLPVIYRHVLARLGQKADGGDAWKGRIAAETANRIQESQVEGYEERTGAHGVPEWKELK